MYLIPTPLKVTQKDVPLTKHGIKLATPLMDARLVKAVSKLPADHDGIALFITYKDTKDEGYHLSISNEEIRIEGDGINGAFYGIQTLRQIFENEEIFCVEIEDAPKNEYRGFYHDITRGRVPTLDSLKALVDDLVYYKINSLQLYVEHAFPFKEHYGTLPESCCTTPEDIRALDEYCKENFVDLIPSIATCSHLFDLLNVPQNIHLRENPNYEQKYCFWFERQDHHTINIDLPESFEFIKSIVDQYTDCFSSEYIHICCDEPFDLLRFNKHRDQDADLRLAYTKFVAKLIDYVKSKGKKVIAWSSILPADRPELKQYIPDDVILGCAGYASVPPEERFSAFQNDNYKTYFCPSTNSYYRFVENVFSTEQNISNMALYGLKYHASGLLNTNWGDYGHPCSIELSMFGTVAGAQVSWNFENKLDDEFKKALNVLLYKHDNGYEYVYKTDRIHAKANYCSFVRYHSNCTFPGREIRWTKYPSLESVCSAAEEAKALYDELKNQKWEKDEFRLELLLALEGTGVIAEYFAKHMGSPIERWTNTENWLKKYRAQWLKRNKESELSRIEEFFKEAEALPQQNKIFTYYGPEMD